MFTHTHSKSWLFFGILVLTVACTSENPFVKVKDDTMSIPIATASGQLVDAAWIDEWLVVQILPFKDVTAYSGRLWKLHPDGSNMEMLPLPSHPTCGSNGLNGFKSPTRLPDGRLGYAVLCRPNSGNFDQDIRREGLYMMAYDLRTGQIQQLVRSQLKGDKIGLGGFSWNPEMTRGITNDWNGAWLNAQLYWFTRETTEYLNLDFPRQFGAAWSPDGKQIGFIAAPEQGLKGMERLNAIYNLYLMESDGTHVRPFIKGFRNPGTIDWSPNGRWFVFYGDFGWWENGLWLIEVSTGKRQRITGEETRYARWSPNGDRLVVIQDNSGQTELAIMDVGTFIK